MTSSSSSIRKFNWLNLISYILNAVVTFGFGTGGWFGFSDNASISEKYQTLVTPVGWAFAIWGIIFLAQLIWVCYQWFAKTERSSPYIEGAVGYNYLAICLAQAGWTFAFGLEQITLSLVMMSLIWVFLFIATQSLLKVSEQNNDVSFGEYMLWVFPFTIHFGWITAATAVNANVVLVALEQSSEIQFYGALVSLIALVLMALYYLQKDLVIPIVIAWALIGVYAEISAPKDVIASIFSANQLTIVRNGSVLAALALVFCVVIKYAASIITKARKGDGNKDSTTSTYSRM